MRSAKIAPMPKQDWTPETMLQVWGARSRGPLRSPLKISTGGDASTDDESQVSFYVEKTPDFETSKPVLTWVYCQHRDVRIFSLASVLNDPRYISIGPMFPAEVLMRMGWGFGLGRSKGTVAQMVLNRFLDNLADRLRAEPFQVIRAIAEEMTPQQIEALASLREG